MIESIQFENFKVLREATLLLAPCTVLVGPNGSGKTTVLQALELVGASPNVSLQHMRSVAVPDTQDSQVKLSVNWAPPHRDVQCVVLWSVAHGMSHDKRFRFPQGVEGPDRRAIESAVQRIRVFSLDARAIAADAAVRDDIELGRDGSGLAAVLDDINDKDPDRFDAIQAELAHWLPEFDAIRFAKPKPGHKSIVLQTSVGHHRIPATDLSQGTLIALALLTLAYLPEPPSIVGLEEPDRGIHPRLLRRVKDAIYRLCYPESSGEKREPVQVIATTHSPYFVDLFKDHPEEIVICEKVAQGVAFKRVADLPHIHEILGDAPLGEAWYTGILGGVPSEP